MSAVVELKSNNVPAFSLVPQNLTEAMELAKIIANSDLAPKDYHNKPGNVLIAVQMGQEVGLSPMTAIQSIAVINGKPALYGDVGKAVLLSRGFTIEEDDIELIKKTGKGRCKITRPKHPPCERTFSIENAKTAGLWGKQGPWTQHPERQLAWRAFWFAARDIASDVLKGLGGAEEVLDYGPRDVTPVIDPHTSPYPAHAFEENLPAWTRLIQNGKKTADDIIATVSTKGVLTEEQLKRIRDVKPPITVEPTVTFEQVEKKLTAAKEMDLLHAAADLIKAVADEAERAHLTDIYHARRDELEGGAQ